MYRLFNSPPDSTIGVTNLTGWRQAQSVIRAELNKLLTYYRGNNNFLPNDHPIVRLLLGLSIPDGNVSIVADRIRSHASNMMSSLYIGSASSRPDFTVNSYFFNRKTYEILIEDDSPFNEEDTYNNWADAKAVSILHHPFNDLHMALPNGNYDGDGKMGYAVIAINPAKLLIQYKGYLDHCVRSGIKMIDAPNVFAYKYVITNALLDVIDLCLRNRFIAMYTGEPLTAYRKRHPLGIIDPTNYVTSAFNVGLKSMRDQVMPFDKVLTQMPAFTKGTQRDITQLPLLAVSRNTKWILDVCRTPLLSFLLRYNRDKPNYQNLSILNDIQNSLKVMENDRSIPSNADSVILTPINQIKEYLSVIR